MVLVSQNHVKHCTEEDIISFIVKHASKNDLKYELLVHLLTLVDFSSRHDRISRRKARGIIYGQYPSYKGNVLQTYKYLEVVVHTSRNTFRDDCDKINTLFFRMSRMHQERESPVFRCLERTLYLIYFKKLKICLVENHIECHCFGHVGESIFRRTHPCLRYMMLIVYDKTHQRYVMLPKHIPSYVHKYKKLLIEEVDPEILSARKEKSKGPPSLYFLCLNQVLKYYFCCAQF